jgi:hypothetical protein
MKSSAQLLNTLPVGARILFPVLSQKTTTEKESISKEYTRFITGQSNRQQSSLLSSGFHATKVWVKKGRISACRKRAACRPWRRVANDGRTAICKVVMQEIHVMSCSLWNALEHDNAASVLLHSSECASTSCQRPSHTTISSFDGGCAMVEKL